MGVELVRGPGGLAALRVDDARFGSATVALHGAHVLSWVPAGGAEVLWLSPLSAFTEGTAVRGGVPLCFPWFGGGPDGTARPSHGYARIRTWQLVDAVRTEHGTVLTLDLAADPGADAWGRSIAATYRVTLGTALRLELEMRNDGEAPAAVEAALHTYLAVSDVRTVAVHGLGGAAYLDRLGGPEPVRQADDVLHLTGETDRIYQGTDATVVVEDPALGRRLSVAKHGSSSTVVWNPWSATAAAMADLGPGWTAMLCVETADVREHAVPLAPGTRHTMTAVIEATTT